MEVNNLVARSKNMIQLKEPNVSKEQEVLAEDKKFLAIIAHDIKTPMGSVIGFLNLIKEDLYEWDRDEIREHIETVLTAAESTYSLLNNLLEWANSKNIFRSYQPELLELDKIIEEEIGNAEIFTAQKEIIINSRVLSGEIVFADENMLKSILRNLISNAIKYSHKFGKIDISTKKDGGFLEITIKDYGVGINVKIVETIFSTENYLSTLGTENEPGTGFGLLLCKELVKICKGKIWVVGNANKGSEFKFTLPISRQANKGG